jgi:hypothetical protein
MKHIFLGKTEKRITALTTGNILYLADGSILTFGYGYEIKTNEDVIKAVHEAKEIHKTGYTTHEFDQVMDETEELTEMLSTDRFDSVLIKGQKYDLLETTPSTDGKIYCYVDYVVKEEDDKESEDLANSLLTIAEIERTLSEKKEDIDTPVPVAEPERGFKRFWNNFKKKLKN